MRNKGRMRVGADADLTIFNPQSVMDQATYESPQRPSAGVVHVLVAGVAVVRDGRPVTAATPGQPIRADIVPAPPTK